MPSKQQSFKAELTRFILANAPEGRTVPLDVFAAGANCGPAAAAAYLNKTCAEIIERCEAYARKGYISQTPMLELLSSLDRPHRRANSSEGAYPSKAFGEFPVGLALIQWEGPGGKYSGWRSFSHEAANTHWIAWSGGLVYDINNEEKWVDTIGTVPVWAEEDDWLAYAVPRVKPRNSPSYTFRSLLVPE